MDHLRTTDLIISRLRVDLRNAFEPFQKLPGTVTSADQTEVKHHCSSASTTLPHDTLDYFSAALAFACLPTAASDARLRRAQLLAHQTGKGLEISGELIRAKLEGEQKAVAEQLKDSVPGTRSGS
jgi:hypothetical protein